MTRLSKTFIYLLLLLLSLASYAQVGVDFLMSMEQGRIDRTVDPDKITLPDIEAQDPRYRPDEGKWFPIKSVLVPEADLHVALSTERNIPKALKSHLLVVLNGKRYHRLFIHPESESFYRDVIYKNISTLSNQYEASATSSSRSVLVRKINDPSVVFFAKLSLNVNLGGVVRTIPLGETARSVGVSDYLFHNNSASARFDIMPEVSGIIPKGFERGGQIIRLIPENVLQGKVKLVPLFALYAQRQGGSLLESMIKKSGVSGTTYVRQNILRPFMEGWVDWSLNDSVVMEAHAQNVLIELDNDMVPTGRFIHRDMGGFNVDTKGSAFNETDKKYLQHFQSLNKEYHQEFSKKAKLESLYVYYEGGFLYNIDLELQRIDPKYVKGSIYQASRYELARSLRTKTGLSLAQLGLENDPDFKFVTTEKKLNQVLERAQNGGECNSFFRKVLNLGR